MTKIKHIINGQDLGNPRDWGNLEITVDWLTKKESGTINVSDLAFVLEAKEEIERHLLSGLTGGVGMFEGIPHEIHIGKNDDDPVFIFEGYLDGTDETVFYGNEEIQLSLKKRKSDDWLTDVADGFSFAYLYDQGYLTNGDFVKVPYVINYIPDGMQLIMLSMSIYMMTKELIENIQKLAETIADITDASTPVIGASVGFGAGVVTAWDLGNFILTVIKAVARLAYIIAITIAIINLIEQIFEQILPRKRNHLGMTFKKMFEVGCNYLGMNFESNIDELNWVHIPKKNEKGGENGEVGFPTLDDPISGFGDFIRKMKEMFNADFRIQNNTFIFKRWDEFISPTSYQLPDIFNNQERLLDNIRYNTDEIIANYNINFAYDIQDQNTLDDNSGRVFQAVTKPRVVNNEDLVIIKGFTEIAIPFSLGREKRELTAVERLAKDLGSVVDGLTGIFGGGTNFESQIEERIGSLLLSSHFLTFGKVVKMTGSKLANNQRQILSSNNLWENYHFINSLAEYNGRHNQWYIFKEQEVPMTEEEFELLLDNNIFESNQGETIRIDRFVYVPERDVAVVDYRINRKYTNNLKVTLL